ncbi:unnamed protein product [Symbiodinium sp. CCMP2592]|nr:unnamed protein product [Symbiodinium sp. CCMP2592]
MADKIHSPDHKRGRTTSPLASDSLMGEPSESFGVDARRQTTGSGKQRQGRALHALSNAELTQGFLLHEEQLALLQLQASLVYKLPTDAPLAQALAKAVAAWQKGHTPGKAHPLGSCAHFTAGAMLVQLAQSQQKPPGIDTAQFKAFIKLIEDFGESPHEAVVHLVAHCSARQNALKTHLILDFRPVLHSPLAQYTSLIAALLDSYEGERLGKKAPGGLARKARGKAG